MLLRCPAHPALLNLLAATACCLGLRLFLNMFSTAAEVLKLALELLCGRPIEGSGPSKVSLQSTLC